MAFVNEEQLRQNLARNLRHLRISRKPYLSQQMLAKNWRLPRRAYPGMKPESACRRPV